MYGRFKDFLGIEKNWFGSATKKWLIFPSPDRSLWKAVTGRGSASRLERSGHYGERRWLERKQERRSRRPSFRFHRERVGARASVIWNHGCAVRRARQGGLVIRWAAA